MKRSIWADVTIIQTTASNTAMVSMSGPVPSGMIREYERIIAIVSGPAIRRKTGDRIMGQARTTSAIAKEKKKRTLTI